MTKPMKSREAKPERQRAAAPAKVGRQPPRIPPAVSDDPRRPILELPTGVYEISRRPPNDGPIEVVAFVSSLESAPPVEIWWVQASRNVEPGQALLPDIPPHDVFSVRRVPGEAGGPPTTLPEGFVLARTMWLSVTTLENSFMLLPPTTAGMALDRSFAVLRSDTTVADILVFGADGTEMVITRGGNAFPPRPPFDIIPLASATLATMTDVSQVHLASPQLYPVNPRMPRPDLK